MRQDNWIGDDRLMRLAGGDARILGIDLGPVTPVPARQFTFSERGGEIRDASGFQAGSGALQTLGVRTGGDRRFRG